MSRKALFAVAAAVLLVPAGASGQLATGQVNVTATVDAYASIAGLGDVEFGSLSRVADNVVDPAGGAGAALRTATFNGDVDITFSSVPATLSGPNGAALAVTLNCAYDDGTGWSAASECSTATFALDNTLAGLATATVGVGGEITAAAVQSVAAGSYSGSLTIVITAR